MDSVVEMCANNKMVHVQYKSKCFSLTDSQNGNDLPSPDSARSTSSLSNRSVESPPDVEMFECLSDSNSVEGDPMCPFLKSSSSPAGLVITDLHNCSYTQRIDNARCGGSGSVDGSSRTSSPLLSSAGHSISESSSLPSCQSFSDGSMDRVLRSNSFCLQDSEQALSISYLAESAGSPATPSDLGIPSLREHSGTPKEQVKPLHLGDVALSENNQTFFLDECTGQSQSGLGVPGKAKGAPLALSPSNVVTPETCRIGPSVVKLLHSCNRRSGPFMTPGDKTFVVPPSEDSDNSNVQTSTPVQSLSNKTFCLPALDESPFTKEPGDQGNSAADSTKHQPASATSKSTAVAKTATAAPKFKKFSKPDFSSVKSKIISRQASTQKSSNLPVVQASPFCSTKRKEDQVQRQAHSAPNKPSTTLASGSSFSATPTKVALSKREAPPSGKQEKPPSSHKKPLLPMARPRLWSESSSVPKSKADTQHQRGKTVPPSFISKVYKAVTQSKSAFQKQQSKQGPQKGSTSSQEDALGKKAEESRSDQPKISPKVVGGKPAVSASRAAVAGSVSRTGAGAISEERKGRFGIQPPPGRERGAPASPITGVNGSRQPPNMARLRLGSNRGFSPSKDSQPPGHSRNVLSNVSAGLGSGPLDAVSGVKHSPKRPLPPITPSRIPTQPQGHIKNISASSYTSGNSTQGFGETCNKGGRTAPSKASGLRPRLQTPAKSTTTTAVCKSSGSSNPTSIKPVSSSSASKRLLPTRPVRTNTAQSVDKSKPRPNARNPQQQQHPPQQTRANGHRDPAVPESKPQSVERYQAQCARSAKAIQELKCLLLEGNCRFEAITIVLQHCITEHEESLRKCGELSLELVNLREELVNSSQSCGRLEQEKEDLRTAFDGVLQKMQEQHHSDLADLEEKLRTFYAAEWDKVHQVYQEEADKCKAQMEEQLENLKSRHEVLRKDLEAIHAEKMESIKQQYEQSLEELRKAHKAEMQTWDKTLKETEVNLTGQIEELRTENSTLNERLKEEEKRREMFADSQKDSQTLYLEQELESLKVVLEIKTNQLHQQDKKLMQMDKVLEKNVKLDESLQKIQQENEDLRARMDKHVALSRQLSTEQAVLQESLQKESNVNKRLSMENEELLWKLHNGDISSPRKLSPSTPSMSLQSPRNSGIFSSPPVSPR